MPTMNFSGKNHTSILTRTFIIFSRVAFWGIAQALLTIALLLISGFVITPLAQGATTCCSSGQTVNGVCGSDIVNNVPVLRTCQTPTPIEQSVYNCDLVCKVPSENNPNNLNNFSCLCTDQTVNGIHSWRCTPANVTCSSGYRVDYSQCPSVSSTDVGRQTYNCVTDAKKGEGETCFSNTECSPGLSCLPIGNYNEQLGDNVCTVMSQGDPNFSKVDPTKDCLEKGIEGISTGLGCIPYKIGDFTPSLLGFMAGIIGAIALVVMLVGTITIMTAGGNPEAIKKGKELFTAAITGLLFIIFSVALLKIIAGDIIKLPGFQGP